MRCVAGPDNANVGNVQKNAKQIRSGWHICFLFQRKSRYILEKVLSYSNYRAMDDMTVLVAGMWKK